MTELAALNIKITGDAGDLKAAVSTATAELGKVQAAAATVPRGFNAAAASGGNLAYTMRGVSQQLSQVGQQTMATGQFVQALAIQLPDIGVAFGAVGAAAGLLAGIALPMLVSAFSGVDDEATAAAAAIDRLKEAQAALAEAVTASQTQIDKLRFGVDEQYQVELLREQIRLRDEYNARVQSLNVYLSTTTDSLDRQKIQTAALRAEIESIALAYQKNATAMENQADRATQLAIIEGGIAQRAGEVAAKQRDVAVATEKVKKEMSSVLDRTISAKDAMVALVASAPSGGWLSAAISDAGTLASKLWDAASAQAALAQRSVEQQPGNLALAKYGGRGTVSSNPITSGQTGETITFGGTGGTGGGDGGGANPLAAELEAMQTAMMTQEMAQIESYTRQQETLVAALDQRLITQEEYAAMMQSAELSHANKMGMIKQSESDMVRQASSAMYGSLEGLLQVFAGKSKAAAIASIALNKSLAIASIIQNTAAAQMKAMFELGPIKGAAAAAKIGMMGKIQAGIVAATGLAQAAGAGGGGGGRAGSVAGPAMGGGGAVETRTANINFYGGFQPTQETIGMIASGLNDWLGDGGRLNMGGA